MGKEWGKHSKRQRDRVGGQAKPVFSIGHLCRSNVTTQCRQGIRPHVIVCRSKGKINDHVFKATVSTIFFFALPGREWQLSFNIESWYFLNVVQKRIFMIINSIFGKVANIILWNLEFSYSQWLKLTIIRLWKLVGYLIKKGWNLMLPKPNSEIALSYFLLHTLYKTWGFYMNRNKVRKQ